MRQINRIILHCSYTRPSQDIGAKEIRDWHVNDNGWSDIGYHWVIRRNGQIEQGRDESISGAHVAGHNQDSIGVCMVGGMKQSEPKPDCNFTLAQWVALVSLLEELRNRYPGAEISGHRDWAARDCPTFDAKQLM